MAKVKQVIRRVMLSISQPRYVIKVRPAATINTGGGGDVSALGELIDVVLTDVEVGQVLKWDGSNWVNETDATGGGGGSTTWGDISGDLADQIDLTEVLDEFDQRIGTKQALLGFTPENGTNKGQPNGYAPLDLFGRSLFEHLPRIPAGYILGRKSPTTGGTELLDPADAATILAVPNGLQAYLGFTPEDVANKGVAGGYAALDGTGRVPAAQTALLDTFTSGAKGLAPASGGGTTNFLRADGTWAAPSGGGGAFDYGKAIAMRASMFFN